MDGPREEHDDAVCREGVYDIAVEAHPRGRWRRGFRVTTNTTLFDGADPLRMRQFFDEMMDLGVEGMMVSPGYSYAKAPDQEHFLRRSADARALPAILREPKQRVEVQPVAAVPRVPHGQARLECTPWGNPTYNIFGWQRPCYLLQEGYARDVPAS